MRNRFGVFFELSQPQMVLRGNRELLVEHCGGIAEYDTQYVRLQFGKGQVEITGTELVLHSMSTEQVVVRGCLHGIQYLPADRKGEEG